VEVGLVIEWLKYRIPFRLIRAFLKDLRQIWNKYGRESVFWVWCDPKGNYENYAYMRREDFEKCGGRWLLGKLPDGFVALPEKYRMPRTATKIVIDVGVIYDQIEDQLARQ
jgi:hypothetical protein